MNNYLNDKRWNKVKHKNSNNYSYCYSYKFYDLHIKMFETNNKYILSVEQYYNKDSFVAQLFFLKAIKKTFKNFVYKIHVEQVGENSYKYILKYKVKSIDIAFHIGNKLINNFEKIFNSYQGTY